MAKKNSKKGKTPLLIAIIAVAIIAIVLLTLNAKSMLPENTMWIANGALLAIAVIFYVVISIRSKR